MAAIERWRSLSIDQSLAQPYITERIVCAAETLIQRRYNSGCSDAKDARRASELLRDLWEEFKSQNGLMVF